MYDKEKGIYPPGQYIVGEDLPIGSYVFTSKGDLKGEVRLFSSYKKFEAQEESAWETFEEDYHMPLRKPGVYIVVDNAEIQKVF